MSPSHTNEWSRDAESHSNWSAATCTTIVVISRGLELSDMYNGEPLGKDLFFRHVFGEECRYIKKFACDISVYLMVDCRNSPIKYVDIVLELPFFFL